MPCTTARATPLVCVEGRATWKRRYLSWSKTDSACPLPGSLLQPSLQRSLCVHWAAPELVLAQERTNLHGIHMPVWLGTDYNSNKEERFTACWDTFYKVYEVLSSLFLELCPWTFQLKSNFLLFSWRCMTSPFEHSSLEKAPSANTFPIGIVWNRTEKHDERKVQNNQLGDACTGSKASASNPTSSGQVHIWE